MASLRNKELEISIVYQQHQQHESDKESQTNYTGLEDIPLTVNRWRCRTVKVFPRDVSANKDELALGFPEEISQGSSPFVAPSRF
ncbi:hypothetical protein DAPPUDRAFT_333799 [Daphnia pulex]|uniref:Uncharacterized protein n=1 Tax=Daphnia pulex TaxID=6669 RepID=E9HTV4_DAPPU|nr:hypothetical protein DAPPUDRAFT_333799 [Daphnia pulex]|eukprot:EFX64828.1 hypothetical protein DAPPUDRAFT_333799 [Daphnia pulex]